MYPEVQLHIAGEWRKGSGGREQNVLNPATGDPVGKVPLAETKDLDEALEAAEAGFKAWRKVSSYDRYKLMRKAADNIREAFRNAQSKSGAS